MLYVEAATDKVQHGNDSTKRFACRTFGPLQPLATCMSFVHFSSGIGQLLLLSTLAGICVAVDSPEGSTF